MPARKAPDPGEESPTPNLSIFEFTPEELKANQRGLLTDKQRGWLQGTARGITSCSMASGVALISIPLNATPRNGSFSSRKWPLMQISKQVFSAGGGTRLMPPKPITMRLSGHDEGYYGAGAVV